MAEYSGRVGVAWIYKSSRFYYNFVDRLRENIAHSRPLSLFGSSEFAMPKRQRYLTKEGQKRLRVELEDLRAVRRPDVAARIHQATEAGGTADNAEY